MSEKKKKKRKPKKCRAKCFTCRCPLTNLLVNSRRERRFHCVRCTEQFPLEATRYGTRPAEVRLAKREAKRLWAEKKRALINQRRKERIAADPEKHREAQRMYRRRYKERLKAGLPPIRELQ